MKKGKLLEQLVWAIRNTLTDDLSYILMPPNYKLKDKNGIIREMDVLLQSNENPHSTYIVFECKDYSTSNGKVKVGLGVVDAFIGKCIDIPNISQKILVSTTGFTKWAKIKAENHNIKLYNIDEIPYSDILFNRSIYNLIPNVLIKTNNWNFELSEEPKCQLCYNKIYKISDGQEIDEESYVKNQIKSQMTDELIASISKKIPEFDRKLNLGFGLLVNKELCIKDKNGESYPINKIVVPIVVEFIKKKNFILNQKGLKDDSNVVSFVTEYKFEENVPSIVFVDAKGKNKAYFKGDNDILTEAKVVR